MIYVIDKERLITRLIKLKIEFLFQKCMLQLFSWLTLLINRITMFQLKNNKYNW